MNCGCLVWRGEKCGGEDMIIVFNYIKDSCGARGNVFSEPMVGRWEKARPGLEMRRGFPAVRAAKHGAN